MICFLLPCRMGEARENDAYEEELLDYEEDEEKTPDAVAAKGSNETAKKYDKSHILINFFRFICFMVPFVGPFVGVLSWFFS